MNNILRMPQEVLDNIEKLKPSESDIKILVRDALHLDPNELSDSDVESYRHASAAMALIVAHLKDGVPLNADRKAMIYGDAKPPLKMLAFVRALCRMAEPAIGKLPSLRLMDELGTNKQ